jgi:hypothetical protein
MFPPETEEPEKLIMAEHGPIQTQLPGTKRQANLFYIVPHD